MAKAQQQPKQNIVASGIEFSRLSWAELKKVHYPTRQETIAATISVMVMIFVFAVLLGFIDFVVGRSVNWLMLH